MFEWGGEFAAALEKAGAAMNFAGGFKEKIGKGGMQMGTRHQLDSGADEKSVARGKVLAQIDGSLGKDQFVEKTEAPRVGIGLAETEQVDFRRV